MCAGIQSRMVRQQEEGCSDGRPDICCFSPTEQQCEDNKYVKTICDATAALSHTWSCSYFLMTCWLSPPSALPTMNLCLRPIGVATTTQKQQYTVAVR